MRGRHCYPCYLCPCCAPPARSCSCLSRVLSRCWMGGLPACSPEGAGPGSATSPLWASPGSGPSHVLIWSRCFVWPHPDLSFLSQDRKRLPAGSASEQQSLLLSAARPAWNLGQGQGGNYVMCGNWTRECWRTGGFCRV